MEWVQTKKFNWCFTCPWKQDQNKWALCFDESGSHTIQNVNSGWYICFKRQLSRILAHFQKTTGLCLGADSWRGERERARGVVVRNRNVGVSFLAFHLHAEDTLFHHMKGRCSYWYVNKVSCVVLMCTCQPMQCCSSNPVRKQNYSIQIEKQSCAYCLISFRCIAFY